MKGLVLYAFDIRRAMEIREYLERQKGYGFDVVKTDDLRDISSDISFIASEWAARMKLYKILCEKGKEFNIAFFTDSYFSDIDETSSIDSMLKKAIRNRDWNTCKGINSFYLMGDIIRKRSVLRSKPSKLQIETTDLCNAKCIMCSHAYDEGTGIDILKSGIIDRLESILPFVNEVVLHGNGEPFLKRDLTTYLKRMSEFGIKFITNTNLSIVTSELIAYLKTSFIELNVSCDGHTQELYEGIRKGLSFKTFLENVRRVRTECPDLCMKMSVVVMRQNIEYMPDLVDFASNLGFDEIIFNQLCVDEKNNNLLEAAYLYPDVLNKYTNLAIRKGRNKKMKVVSTFVTDSAADSDSSSVINITSTVKEELGRGVSTLNCFGICDWVVECPYIDLRGNVSACCINQKQYLGNLFEKEFESIWNGATYRNVRKNFILGELPRFCRGCDFLIQNRLQYLTSDVAGLEILRKEKRS